MLSYMRGSERAYEFLKLLRSKPHTREQISRALGWSKRAAHYWVADGLAHGVLVETEAPDTDEPIYRNPPKPKLVSLAPAWRGGELPSAAPGSCACFPGTCRGGQVVNGRLANGQRCKAA